MVQELNNQPDPAFIDALLEALTEQRNSALNEVVNLVAGNKQLVNKLQTMENAIGKLTDQINHLKFQLKESNDKLEAFTPKAEASPERHAYE